MSEQSETTVAMGSLAAEFAAQPGVTRQPVDIDAAGALIATPGARIDFTVIEEVLKDWADRFAIQEFAYDPRELNDFVNRVGVWASFPRIEVTQGPNMMSEPMKELEAQVEAKTLVHADDPILNWMASNVVKKEARGGGPVKYYYPTKQSAAKKIDGIVAAIMAIGRAMLGGTAPIPGIAFL